MSESLWYQSTKNFITSPVCTVHILVRSARATKYVLYKNAVRLEDVLLIVV
jgi:hypothetical protein